MQAVFSYGGAMVFPEFMSEMRRPRDFLKGMWAAQAFIYVVYMVRLDCPQVMTLLSDVFFRSTVSSFTTTRGEMNKQIFRAGLTITGQYVVNPSYLGVSGYTLQTVGNVLAMVSALIAAALYGNIGIKGELINDEIMTGLPSHALSDSAVQ